MELALILPAMVSLLFGTVEYGRAFNSAMVVTHAAAVGAQYGAQSLVKSQDSQGMINAATAAAADIPGFSATAVRSCTCWSPSAGAETAMSICTSPCTSPSVVRIYVTVIGMGTFRAMVNYPGIPNSIALRRTARLRVQ